MIKRTLASKIKEQAGKMPVVVLNGPRQSGKTTLAKSVFPGYQYINFEDLEIRDFAKRDPKGFLKKYSSKIILDEAQHVPELFNYIQLIVDEVDKPGMFILTGSQNFQLNEKISQSLAGRVSLIKLAPFSIEELNNTDYSKDSYFAYLTNGFYPRVYDKKLNAIEWYSDYINTYVERDVRKMVNIGDLTKFQLFLKVCAGRIAQLFNASQVATEIGVSTHTVQSWLSILEASFIIFRVAPYYKNYNKRIIKTPKLYFYDVGLASYLLGLRHQEEISFFHAKGALFENLVIADLLKTIHHHHSLRDLFFWRDNTGNELDCLIEHVPVNKIIEIKSSETIHSDFFLNLKYHDKITAMENKKFLVYGGNDDSIRENVQVYSWKNAWRIVQVK